MPNRSRVIRPTVTSLVALFLLAGVALATSAFVGGRFRHVDVDADGDNQAGDGQGAGSQGQGGRGNRGGHDGGGDN
jgi:hypothetical protein